MADTSEVIWGHFRFEDGGKTLRDIASDQTLHLSDASEGSDHVFRYRDPDLDASVVVSVIGSTMFEVDFNGHLMREVADDYALWRRLAFFLPDALLVWFCDMTTSHTVRLLGGWQNATWKRSFSLTSRVTYAASVSGANRSAPPWVDRLDLLPIDSRPLTWHYVAAPIVAPAVELKTVPGEVPRLDRTVPLELQLANALRVVRQDGNAALFLEHVLTSCRREDYEPMPRYGYVNRNVAFSVCADGWSGVSVRGRPTLVRAPTASRHFKEVISLSTGPMAEPSLALREELLFALIDIQGVLQSIDNLPTIRKEDHCGYRELFTRDPKEAEWMSDIVFGLHLDKMDGTPRRSPFDAAALDFQTRWKFE